MSMPSVACRSSPKMLFGSKDQLGQGCALCPWARNDPRASRSSAPETWARHISDEMVGGLVGPLGKLGCLCPAGDLAALLLGACRASRSLTLDD